MIIDIGYYFETHEVQLLYDFSKFNIYKKKTLKKMTWCNVTSKGLISSIESFSWLHNIPLEIPFQTGQ